MRKMKRERERETSRRQNVSNSSAISLALWALNTPTAHLTGRIREILPIVHVGKDSMGSKGKEEEVFMPK